ncbi:MAG: hypothetical protein HY226_01035 [Candidatus Vogelbacteria bacterium]|nr:hypothetical protein [Candidatus Vogelbacteria bacterium]
MSSEGNKSSSGLVNIGSLYEISSPDAECWDLKLGSMFRAALAVRQNAQAPYSKFLVGAAVESEKGNVYVGCNVERCSYSQGTHAEQNAVDTMIAVEGSVKIKRLVLAGAMSGDNIPIEYHGRAHSGICGCDSKLVLSCGHCRQIIWENCLGDKSVRIYTLSMSGHVFQINIGDLYPFPFGPEDIGVKYGNIGGQNG